MMYFLRSRNSKRSQVLRDANTQIQATVDDYFREHQQAIRQRLTGEGFTPPEQDHYLADLKRRMQLKMIQNFKEADQELHQGPRPIP